ncbi:MAG: AraC family transcriptional regulator [Verrucomicrobiota bacterium]
MPSNTLRDLQRVFRRETGFNVVETDAGGNLIGRHESGKRSHWRIQVIREALRWGEACVMTDDDGLAGWGLPLMTNSLVTGGLLVERVPLEGGEPGEISRQIRAAAGGLLDLMEKANLVNADFLRARRNESRRERERAEAIHALKNRLYDGIRDLYLREEPGLLAAIKRGERQAARETINRVLVGIYHAARSRPQLLKSLALELVVVMSRAAVESGADPSEVLGCNFESATALAGLSDEEEVSTWLCGMLERVMDAIRDHKQFPNAVLLGRAVAFMEENLGEPLDRDSVARAAGLSGSHFSHLIRERTGRTFTDLMAQYRVDRAKTMLRRTGKSIVQIAMECGFEDQSYFSRVFKRYTGTTPRSYRGRGES